MGSDILREVRGVMTRFDVLTADHVAAATHGELTYTELTEELHALDLDIQKVVFDETRSFQNAFYADYEHGWYSEVYLHKVRQGILNEFARFVKASGPYNPLLVEKDWEAYYLRSVPLPMAIYDFQRRYLDIAPEKVFNIWYSIHVRIDYANGMWDRNILEYVFSHAPKPDLPPLDDDGMITIYRGAGGLSQPPSEALSWSTQPEFALWFANHSHRGTKMWTARVHPNDIVAHFPSNRYEYEVIVRPGANLVILDNDMIPSTEDHVPRLLVPVTRDFFRFGKIACSLGYPQEGEFQYHGIGHILRVLLLSLIYVCHSGDELTTEDKQILIYFSLLHDIGRQNENIDETHGQMSLDVIRKRNIRIKGLVLSKKGYRIANLLIANHCRPDEAGIAAIHAERSFSAKDKARTCKLYAIAKDMDGLDRVRFNGLDFRQLRTPYAKRLPLVAGGLLAERLAEIIQQRADAILEATEDV